MKKILLIFLAISSLIFSASFELVEERDNTGKMIGCLLENADTAIQTGNRELTVINNGVIRLLVSKTEIKLEFLQIQEKNEEYNKYISELFGANAEFILSGKVGRYSSNYFIKDTNFTISNFKMESPYEFNLSAKTIGKENFDKLLMILKSKSNTPSKQIDGIEILIHKEDKFWITSKFKINGFSEIQNKITAENLEGNPYGSMWRTIETTSIK